MFRKLGCALVLALPAGSVPAIAAQAAAEVPPVVDPVGRIRGTVTDAGTGAPVSGACVSVIVGNFNAARLGGVHRPAARVCTGADGRYSIPDVWAGRWTVRVGVSAPGYREQWWPGSFDYQTDAFAFAAGPLLGRSTPYFPAVQGRDTRYELQIVVGQNCLPGDPPPNLRPLRHGFVHRPATPLGALVHNEIERVFFGASA